MTWLILLHVLGATIWTGGHLVLSVCILPRALAEKDPTIVTAFEERFEKLGLPALLVQVVTGPLLAFHHVPYAADWFAFNGTKETLIATKLLLLAATLGLALHARLRVLPTLTESRLRLLAWHIVPVTVLSVLFVVVGVFIRTAE
jgi:putative copper export protein